MKIAFSFHGCGAGNNGGTRTVFLSAIELSNLGVDVEIWSDSQNQFTWFMLPPQIPFIVKPSILYYDPVDIVIATGSASVIPVASLPNDDNWYWVRAIETWAMSEADLISGYRSGLHLMANSIWQKQWIESYAKVECQVLRPGIETEFYSPPVEKPSTPVVIGALYSHKPRKRGGDIYKIFTRLKEKYGDQVEFALLSAESLPSRFPCDHSYIQPSEKVKREMYQRTHIWFAPTDNEGLHVPPMEAGLCGCALVAHGIDEAGMGDYAIHGKTALTYPRCDLDEAFRLLCSLVDDKALRDGLSVALREYVISKIGSRRGNMMRFLEFVK